MSLNEYLNQLQANERYYFLVSEIEKEVGIKKSSISASLSRLAKKGRLRIIRRGFGILLGANGKEPHPSSYIEPMMKFVGAKYYYVGLLAAASHWGASHQASMSYQVFSDRILKTITFDRGRIEFVTRKDFNFKQWIQRISTHMGYFQVSTPELTALDLIRFPTRSGGLNNIATILEELVSEWNGRTMKSLCNSSFIPTLSLQRLGYMLDVVLGLEKESLYIKKALDKRSPVSATLTKLANGNNMRNYEYNRKWMLYINTEVESD